MTTDHDTPRFETIDWEREAQGGHLDLTHRTLAALGSLLLLAVAFVYDYLAVPAGRPLVAGWDVTQLDWLFFLSLLVVFFYVVVPLYANRRMTGYYWYQFKRNRAAVVSLGFLAVFFVVGLLGPLLLDRPELALERKFQPPVFMTIPATVPIECFGSVTGAGLDRVCHGTWAHPLGTTGTGKDILTLVVFGMQVSMKIALISSLLVVSIGVTVGALSAYSGGMVDEVLMRYVDIQQVFPTFLLYLLLIFLFGGSLFMFILVFGLTSWGGTARLVRSAALQRNEEEFILVSKAAGAGPLYVIRRHLIPNVSSTIITNVTLLIPGFILFEAGLAFLSLGDPTIPSWGQTIAAGRNDLTTAWWISTVPGFFVFFTILAFNFVGDALRDALDPRAGGGA